MIDEPRADGAPVKCLIVDDMEENLLALHALLRRDGIEVLQARSGPQALELLLQHDVALALIDVQMPTMDGFELAELMRGTERTRRVPIIFVTAGARDQQRLFKGYESGAVDFLFKPVEAHILNSKADVFFQLHRQTRQLAQQLRERSETLRLNEMFTAVLGHDLRGPLSAIMMSAHVLDRAADPGVKKVGARLLRSGHWMSRMIEDVLDLTRARLGNGIVVQRERCDLGEVVDRVVQERQSSAPQRLIRLQRHGDLAGEFDEVRIAQVASNLIGNALVHGQADAPVDVGLDGRDAAQVTLAVQNAGLIAPELLPQIFDPFRSGRQSSQRTEGLGLGLFIVQQIVQAHGGRVAVESPAGDSGTTLFRITLPRR